MTIERMPPQAVDIEQAVVGCMLSDNATIDSVREEIMPDAFYHKAHGLMFIAAMYLHDKGHPVDQLSLTEELRTRDQLDECGGIVYVAKIASEVASGANVMHYTRIVRRKHMQRQCISLAADMSEMAYRDAEEPNALIGSLYERLTRLQTGCKTDGLTTAGDFTSEAMGLVTEAKKNKGKLTGIDTSLPSLNKATGGMQRGDLWVIGARPSFGKTAWALGVALKAAMQGHCVAVFSLEMSRSQVGQRLLSQGTGVDLLSMRTGRLTDDCLMQLERGAGRIAVLPIYVDDTPAISCAHMRGQCRRIAGQRQIDLIIVDYLQLMEPDERVQSREQAVGSCSRGIKALAKEFNAPAVALTQLSRKLEDRTDHRARASDCRESGSLEQDADCIGFLNKPSHWGTKTIRVDGKDVDSDGWVEFDLNKHRNGPTVHFWMRWDKHTTTFAEPAQGHLLDGPDDDGEFQQHASND